jgi:putative Holliday junction resolvase
MAFDYGTRRVGIAVTDPLQIIATSLTTLPPAQVPEFVRNYMSEERVERFVVGMPRQLDGSESQSAQHVKGFVRQLKKLFPSVEVVTIDERFTSKMASAAIAVSGLKRARRQEKGLVDSVSAVIILQSYLEQAARG